MSQMGAFSKIMRRGRLFGKWLVSVFRGQSGPGNRTYWEWRAREYGAKGVLNLALQGVDLQQATEAQMEALWPILRSRLTGNERVLLDFGCGPGRFTGQLSELCQGECVGADPVLEYLAMAPRGENVSYVQLSGKGLPFASETFDLEWIVLVLGGVTQDHELRVLARELERILKRDGLLFVAENSTESTRARHWVGRDPSAYQEIFAGVALEHVADYREVNQRISVLVGRKC